MYYDADTLITSKGFLIVELFVIIALTLPRISHLSYVAEGKLQEEVEAEEQAEEEEAKTIQKRLAANLSEEDYDLSFFQVC